MNARDPQLNRAATKHGPPPLDNKDGVNADGGAVPFVMTESQIQSIVGFTISYMLVLKVGQYVVSHYSSSSLSFHLESFLLQAVACAMVVIYYITRISGRSNWRNYYYNGDARWTKNFVLLVALLFASVVAVVVLFFDLQPVRLYVYSHRNWILRDLATTIATHGWSMVYIKILLSFGLGLLIGPIVEEFLFRGLLLNALKKYHGVLTARLIVIALFVGAHDISLNYSVANIQRIIGLAACGYILTYCAERARSLIPGTVFHAGNNVVACLLLVRPLWQ